MPHQTPGPIRDVEAARKAVVVQENLGAKRARRAKRSTILLATTADVQ